MGQDALRKTTWALAAAGTFAQIIATALTAALGLLGVEGAPWHLASTTAIVTGSMPVISFWLRSLTSQAIRIVALVAFAGIALSETLTPLFALLHYSATGVVTAAASLLQLPLMGKPYRVMRERISHIASPSHPSADQGSPGYLKLIASMENNPGFLLSNLFAAAVMSVAIGFLWGFPDGGSHTLTWAERLLCALSAVGIPLLVAQRITAHTAW